MLARAAAPLPAAPVGLGRGVACFSGEQDGPELFQTLACGLERQRVVGRACVSVFGERGGQGGVELIGRRADQGGGTRAGAVAHRVVGGEQAR